MFVLASIFTVSAQKTQNEGYVGYNFVRQDVKFVRPNFRFDENTDSHGASVGYTRYLKGKEGKAGVAGLTGEVSANFDKNEASLVTVMAGGILKARNMSYVQPYMRVMGGAARQNVNRRNIRDTSDISAAFDVGAGLDFSLSKNSRYALRTGVDYVNTGFNGERQSAVRLTAGIVF